MLKQSLALNWINRWDTRLSLGFNRAGQAHGVSSLFRVVSRMGDGVFWYVLMLFLLAYHGRSGVPAVLQMVITGLICAVLYKWLKGKTLRPRPFQVHQEIRCGTAPLDQFSFPSGHTLHAVAFSIVALAYYPPLIWLVVPFTLLVALSRVVLGLHYPSDVVAAALVGALVASLSLSLVKPIV